MAIRFACWRLLAAVTVATLSNAQLLCAQSTPQADPQAVSVASQALSATGAVEPSLGSMVTSSGVAIQDSVATGSISFADGQKGTLRIETKGLNRQRFELTIGTTEITTIYNSGTGYSAQGSSPRRRLPVWVSQYRRPEHIPALSRIADYQQPTSALRYAGLETLSGISVHHIKLTSAPTDSTPAEIENLISEFHAFIDSHSYLVVKTITFDFSPEVMENRSKVETYFSDYRNVNGLLVPYRVTRYVEGQLYSDFVLTNVALNVGVSDADFQ